MSNGEDAVQPAVTLENIGQIPITVSDLARAKDSFGQTLGLKHLFDAGTMSFFECGDVRLLIGAGAPTDAGCVRLRN